MDPFSATYFAVNAGIAAGSAAYLFSRKQDQRPRKQDQRPREPAPPPQRKPAPPPQRKPAPPPQRKPTPQKPSQTVVRVTETKKYTEVNGKKRGDTVYSKEKKVVKRR